MICLNATSAHRAVLVVMKENKFLLIGLALALCACVSQPAPNSGATLQPAPDNGHGRIGTPAWFETAIIYQIFPRSFYDSNGDGIGDLRGMAQKLDYVQSLGANTIWLNPHYPSDSYHGYDVNDYLSVNPQFGTLDDFKFLVSEMHTRKMRLVVDFVANHSGSSHPFFKDAYKNPSSKYTSWYRFADAANTTYDTFFGSQNLPRWNHENPAVRKYLIDAALYWLDLGVDGLRFDYVLGLNEVFVREARQAIKAKKPDAVMLGEIWDNGDAINKYLNWGFDAAFDFPYALTLDGSIDANGDGVINGQSPAFWLDGSLQAQKDLYPSDAQLVRFVSNHDTNRIASEVNGDPARERLAAASAFLLPGIPIVYYGEELGMRGSKGSGPFWDEYRREPMDWYATQTGAGMTRWFSAPDDFNNPNDGISVEEEDKNTASLLSYYRALGVLRYSFPALRSRQFEIVHGGMETDCGEQCLLVYRWVDNQIILEAFNFSGQPRSFHIQALPNGNFVPVIGDMSGNDFSLMPWGVGVFAWNR